MKSLIVLSAVVWLAGGTLTGQEILVKQRAKELRDQNNVRQGVPPPQQPVAPVQPAPPAAAPRPVTGGLSAAAQQNIATLQADLAAIKTKPHLFQHLMSAVVGAAKPSQEAVTSLAVKLLQALADKDLPPDQQTRLARDLNAILNCAALSQDQIQGVASDAQAILQANGVKRSEAVAIADDLKAIAAEVKQAARK